MHFASTNHWKEKNKLRVSLEGKKKDETRGKEEERERKWTDLRQQWVNFCVHFWIFKNYIYIYSPLKTIEQSDVQGQKSEIGNGRVIFSRVSTIDPRSPNDKTLEDSFVPRDPECVIAPFSAKRAFEGVKSDESVGLRGQGVE